MRIVLPVGFLLMAVAGPPAASQPVPVLSVQLSNFKFSPDGIVMDHGQPYILHLANVAGGGHDFTASDFFAAANVAAADRHFIADGEVEVPPGRAIDIHLTAPAPGRYKLKCSHAFHKALGMSGTILVR